MMKNDGADTSTLEGAHLYSVDVENDKIIINVRKEVEEDEI